MAKKKKKKYYRPGSWEAELEDAKKITGLKTWQVYLISITLFVLNIIIIIFCAILH